MDLFRIYINIFNIKKIILNILLLKLFVISLNYNQFKKLNKLNEVNITIKGQGYYSPIATNSIARYQIGSIYINGIIKSISSDNLYYMDNEEENEVYIVFYQNLLRTREMFRGLSRITKIDLSNFNFSDVKDALNMFYECESLTSIKFGNTTTKSLENMAGMFRGCLNLLSLDLSMFDTSKVKYMGNLFLYCTSLKELNIDNFDTSKVQLMTNMFSGLKSITSLDVSHLNTSSVTVMQNMFGQCSLLTSLNLENFDTSKVTRLDYMFANCYSLKNVEIKNFNTSSTISLVCMFYNCTSLTSLDLNHFNTSSVNDTRYMFNNSYNLQYLEISNFNLKSVKKAEYMFENCSSLISLNLFKYNVSQLELFPLMFEEINPDLIYCINITKDGEILDSLVNYTFNCSYFCFQKEEKMIDYTNECINSCSDSLIYKYEYKGICYEKCSTPLYYDYTHTKCIDEIPEGYYLNDTEQRTIEKCIIKCKECSMDSLVNNLCLSCNDIYGYYKKYDENLDLENNIFINCYKEAPEGYVFDSINKFYKSCYSTCKDCTELGNIKNHKCTECYDSYTMNEGNCSTNCDNYFIYISPSEYECIENETCPNNYNKLIIDKKECIDDCNKDNSYRYEYNNTCYVSCPPGTKISKNNVCMDYIEEETDSEEINSDELINRCNGYKFFTYQCIIDYDNPNIIFFKNMITEDLLKGDINSLIIPKVFELNEELINKINNISFLLTSTYDQENYNELRKNHNYNNSLLSIIKLGDCEDILRSYYKLNETDELILFIIEIGVEGYLIPIIEYEVFSLKVKEKLDLNLCNNTKINILHNIDINENILFKYDLSNPYYHDICYPYTTENNTDIILNDRRNEFIDNNMTLCEANCEFIGYDINTKQADCKCNVKNEMNLLEFKIDKNLLLNNFKNIKNTMNLFVLKCYKLLFTSEFFLTNIGNYILLSIIIIDIICTIYFISKGWKILNFSIQHFIESININHNEKTEFSKIDNINRKNHFINAIENTNMNINLCLFINFITLISRKK